MGHHTHHVMGRTTEGNAPTAEASGDGVGVAVTASVSATTTDELRHPEFEKAVARKKASFGQLFEAHYGTQEWSCPDPQQRELYARYIPSLMTAFENEHGNITDLYFAQAIRGGAVMTDRHNVYFMCDPQRHDNLMKLLRRCDRLAEQSDELLRGWSRTQSLSRTFAIATDVLAILERAAPPKAKVDRNQVRTESVALSEAEAFFDRASKTQGQFHYLAGMVLGAVAAAVLAVLVDKFVSRSGVGELLVTSIAGAVGAIVSVMTRIHQGNLRISLQQGLVTLWIVGGVRPVLGAIFGAVAGLAILSGLLPLSLPTDPDKGLYFMIVLGFVAGFSERFARDVIGTTVARLGGGSKDQNTSADRQLVDEESSGS